MFKFSSRSKKPSTTSAELKYNDFFNDLRTREYQRLDEKKDVYLDYTGGNLYAQSQLEKHLKLLSENTFGNPHSTNPTSKLATELVKESRAKVIDFFNAEDYYCVFTQNASMGLKVVGECYPFDQNGHFLLFADNHNSVNGIREYCLSHGGSHDIVPMNYDDLTVSDEALNDKLSNCKKENKLFAFPAQSNVSGVKHDLKWIESAQNQGWDVILDAAAFVPTSRLDLNKYKPDYVVMSFYKIFGYPTGLGCLLVKKSSFAKLEKKWFAGGTVSLASSMTPFHFLVDNHERFENGTIDYLGIPAIKMGLEHIENIQIDRLTERISSLVDYLISGLKDLTHSTGESQLDIFGPESRENTGGTIIMSFKNPDGSKVNFDEVEKMANEKRISIRSGCFCNPGLDESINCLTTEEISNYFTTRENGDYHDMIKALNKMRGATRVSVGLATNQADLDTFISFVKSLKDKTIQ